MRLVVEEAQDHSTCMEIVRQRHGADCVVVHSFRVEDQYRIVVALETETTTPAVSALTDAVRDVIAPAVPAGTIKWDTFIDDVSSMLESSACLVFSFSSNNLGSSFPGSLSFSCHGSLELFRNSDILHLHSFNKDSPRCGCRVKANFQLHGNRVPLRQNFSQVSGSQNVPQSGCCQRSC